MVIIWLFLYFFKIIISYYQIILLYFDGIKLSIT